MTREDLRVMAARALLLEQTVASASAQRDELRASAAQMRTERDTLQERLSDVNGRLREAEVQGVALKASAESNALEHARLVQALRDSSADCSRRQAAQQAAEAYKEFLHGLQLIGAQETINQHGVHSKNILELYNWERQIQGAVRVAQYGACGTCCT